MTDPIGMDLYLLRKEETGLLEEQFGPFLDFLNGPANRQEKLETLDKELSRSARLAELRVLRAVPRKMRAGVKAEMLRQLGLN